MGTSNGLVKRFEANGDTEGDDIGNNTSDDSYLNIYFNQVNITMADLPALAAPFPYQGYQIGNKMSGMLLDVRGGLAEEKNPIWQYQTNLSASQRFVLIPNGAGFFIKPNVSDLYFTVRKPEPGVSMGEGSGGGVSFVFFQDKLYRAPRPMDGTTAISVNRNNQTWNLISTGEDATYFLEFRAFPGMVLQSSSNQSGAYLMLAAKVNSDNQKWIIRRPKVNDEEAGFGLNALWVDAPGLSSTTATRAIALLKGGDINGARIRDGNIDVNILAPAHRSVGEMRVYEKPIESYQRLEGIVLESECQVAVVDFPTCHYTHDMTYRVKPNTSYESLLATSLGDPDHQKNIEIEWETGLGQRSYDGNPARPFNVYGNSFGFFSEGHKRNNIIWNWPSPGDSIYIEGMWIWERGHGVPHTEIHPPHFVATKRHIPISFNITNNLAVINNQPQDQFYGQRVDVFASADGSTMWNTKGLQPFAQVVNMKRQDYIFNVTTMFAKPSATAVLKWKVIRQPGNSFSGDPQIRVLVDGKTVQVNYPWKTRGIANTIKVAQTILLYWDSPETKGIHPSQKPDHFNISLDAINIIDNGEFGSSINGGECMFYGNIGSNWIMLNEFATSSNNVLENGLGNAEDNTTTNFNRLKFGIYLMPEKRFRVHTRGWENDHMNGQMGRVLSEYNRSTRAIKPFLGEIFTVGGIVGGQIEDEDMYEAEVYINKNSENKSREPLPARNGKYRIFYSVSKSN